MRPSINLVAGILVLALLSGCEALPPEQPVSQQPVPAQATPPAGTPAAGTPPPAGAAGAPAAAGAAAGVPAAPVPARATNDFARAVGFMKAGNTVEAELEFKQMTLAYPTLAAPYVNLGIIYRQGGHLDQSEQALRSAVERNGSSAVAWTELGATQRLRGEFPDAAASYEHAIAADASYAPAYRNLGVVSDLYLGDPERALSALERYKELTGEDRPVTSWIAELRQRTGKPPLRPAGARPADKPGDAASGVTSPGAAAPVTPPANGTAPNGQPKT